MLPMTPGGERGRAAPTHRVPGVLAIHPENQVLEMVLNTLGSQGYDVRTAASLQEGLAALAASNFDLVLVDRDLERASNGRLVVELSRYPAQTVSLIILTSPEPGVTVEALRRGAYDCLVKPFEPDLLRVTVARAVERTTLARTTRELVEELEVANLELRMAGQELHRRIDEATRDLVVKVEELNRVRLELEEARRQRDDYIHVVAHELAGPLTAVEGYAEILGDRRSVRRAHPRASAVIRAETRRMARLVEDLAGTAQSADSLSLDLGRCDLVDIVSEQIELARVLSSAHSVTAALPRERVPVWCDRDRIGQVVFNLLSNALKYSAGGEVRVAVTADEHSARVSVADSGPGIPPDQTDAIFELRVRLVGSGPDQPGGSGLGLYVARQIARAHRGNLHAESSSEGATFHLSLPLAR